VVDTVRDTLGVAGTANVPTVVIGVVAIVVLAAGRKLAPRFPTPLVVLVASTAATWALSLTDRGVAVLGSVPTGLPSPQVPELTGALVADVAPVALAIAVIAYAEGVSVAKAIARRQRSRIEANQELVATGAANVAAGMFGAFPVAGGFSRTAVNDQAGSRTPLASLITAVVLAVAVVWLTPALFYLPKAVLAAVVIVAVSGLVDVADARETWRTRKSDFVALAVTFLVTLVVGVEPGLATGVVFSLVLFIYRSANPHTTELGRVVGTTEFRNVDRWQTRSDARMVLLRVDGPLFFANTKFLADRVAALLADRPTVTHVVLDAAGIGDLDASGSHGLAELDADLSGAGVTLLMATVRGPVRDVMAAAGLWDPMRPRIFASVNDAVASVDPASALLVADADEPPTTVV
jgi:SulP family sulfate permease